MGTGGSKYPEWYPGEPDPALCSFRGECHCVKEGVSSSDAPAAPGDVRIAAPSRVKVERKMELLPVVELTDWKVGGTQMRKVVQHGCCCERHHLRTAFFGIGRMWWQQFPSIYRESK